MPLTLRQLQYFVAVVEGANMSRAAARLHVAPTALSLQVKAMEEALGVRLLERHSRGVRPTERGQRLFERARQILALVDETEREVGPDAWPAVRTLRLGMPPAAARTIGVEIFSAPAGFAGVALEVSQGWSADLMDRLRAKELDLVIGYEAAQSHGIEVCQLLEERFVLAGTPQLIGSGESIDMARALDQSLIFYGDRSVASRAVREAAAASGAARLRTRQVAAIDIWRTMLCRGVAAAITPFGAIADECRRGELVARLIDRPPLVRRLGLAGGAEAMALARSSGLASFLADLVVSAHLALGPYYRAIDRPADAAAAATHPPEPESLVD